MAWGLLQGVPLRKASSLRKDATAFVKSVFVISMLSEVFTILDSFLNPMRCAADGARLIQARHSPETIITTLVSLFAPRRGRSVI